MSTGGYGDDPEDITVCPECQSPQIRRTSTRREECDGWWCTDCNNTFEEPATRPPKCPGSPGPAGSKLLEMDPDEI